MGVMDSDLLTLLIDQHAAPLVLLARQWCRTPEDVVQQAFIQLAAQASLPQRPAAWLYRTVRNGAISAWRSEKRRRQHETAAAARAPNWFMPAENSRLDQQHAAEALATLPLETREVVVAHLWGGRTFEEIGELTGVSASTAYRVYAAGLAAMRERLEMPCPQ